MILDRAAFDAINDVEFAYVDVPEADPDAAEVPQVRVRSLTGDQRTRLRRRSEMEQRGEAPPTGNWQALCCAMGLVDNKGVYLYPNEADGAVLLGRRHEDMISRIANKILELSVMTKASRALAEKKSATTTTNNGGSSSPAESTPGTDSTLTS